MLYYRPEYGKKNIIEAQPGEIKVRLTADLFVDSKRLHNVFDCLSHIDGMIELTRILKESKSIKRAIIQSHGFYRDGNLELSKPKN